MSPTSPYRPRVARETRLLLTTALLSTAALWTLARVQPVSIATPAGPVPLLTPFVEAPYARLSGDVARVQSRLEASLLVLNARDPAASGEAGSVSPVTGLRLTGDRVLTVEPAQRRLDLGDGLTAVGQDPASGLTLVRSAQPSTAGSPVPWPGESLRSPRYLVATDVSGTGIALRPVFVGGFDEISGPLGPVLWRPLSRVDLSPGTILFTLDGELVGVAVDDGGSPVVLPGRAVLDSASKLETAGIGVAGRLGVDVQDLTPSLAMATGSKHGVVVAWVEPGSPASETLTAGDVLEEWEGQPLDTTRDWNVRMARLRSGDAVRLGVRSRGAGRELSIVAAARAGATPMEPRPAPALARLGLTMRRVGGTGIAVTDVAPDSVAFRAGITAGDIVTRVGDLTAPTPEQVRRAFGEARAGTALLVAVTREDRHFVTTLHR